MSGIGKNDLEAALELRREQGRQIEPALVDALAHRIEGTVRQRFEAEVVERRRSDVAHKSSQNARIAVGILSLIISIPLTGIAGEVGGILGMAIVWTGLVLINIALAMRPPFNK